LKEEQRRQPTPCHAECVNSGTKTAQTRVAAETLKIRASLIFHPLKSLVDGISGEPLLDT
jgi:hypothetical protein